MVVNTAEKVQPMAIMGMAFNWSANSAAFLPATPAACRVRGYKSVLKNAFAKWFTLPFMLSYKPGKAWNKAAPIPT